MYLYLYVYISFLSFFLVTTRLNAPAGRVFNSTEIVIPPSFIKAVQPFRIERPKVIFNTQTQMYVLVFHCEDAPYKVGGTSVTNSPHPLSLFLSIRGHWWGAPTPLAHPISVSSRVGSRLPLPLYADVRLHIPMTHRNDRYRTLRPPCRDDETRCFLIRYCIN